MRSANLGWVLLVLGISSARAADLTATQVRQMLASAGPETPADLPGKSLENLDLSNLDFRRVNLAGANLFGAKLDSADFQAPTSPAPGSISPGSCGRTSPTPTCLMPVSSAS